MSIVKEKLHILLIRENASKKFIAKLLGITYHALFRKLNEDRFTNNEILKIANHYGYEVQIIISEAGGSRIVLRMPESNEVFSPDRMSEILGLEVDIIFKKVNAKGI